MTKKIHTEKLEALRDCLRSTERLKDLFVVSVLDESGLPVPAIDAWGIPVSTLDSWLNPFQRKISDLLECEQKQIRKYIVSQLDDFA